jgi:phage gp46-like protein
MIYAATETRFIIMTPAGTAEGPSVFPPPDEWSPDPVNGVYGDSLELLESCIAISLYTDARVEASELAPGESERRGFWGDTFPEVEGDTWGGRVWLADSARLASSSTGLAGSVSPSTIARWCRESLLWMVEDGIVSSVDVTAERNGANRVDVEIVIERFRPEDPIAMRYAFLWED